LISDLSANCCNVRALVAAAALIGLGGCAPNNIARGSCTNTVLSVHDEWTCTVKGDIVGQASSIEFDTESRNHIAEVNFTLQVTKGSLRVRYADLSGSRQIIVTPSEPANVNMKTKMHPERRSFTLSFEPVNGIAEGLTGTVKYSTP
jgi:hypothetical protein